MLHVHCVCLGHVRCMWFACGQIFQTRSAIARFGSFVVTMVCAIGGGPGFQFNSIEDCPDVHVRGSWFSAFQLKQSLVVFESDCVTMQQHSGGVLSSLLYAPLLLSQGFAVCKDPHSEKGSDVAEETNLALIEFKMDTTSKKYVVHQTTDLCCTNTSLKTPCQSPCHHLMYQNKEDMKSSDCNLMKMDERGLSGLEADKGELVKQLIEKIESRKKDPDQEGERFLSKDEWKNGSIKGERVMVIECMKVGSSRSCGAKNQRRMGHRRSMRNSATSN